MPSSAIRGGPFRGRQTSSATRFRRMCERSFQFRDHRDLRRGANEEEKLAARLAGGSRALSPAPEAFGASTPRGGSRSWMAESRLGHDNASSQVSACEKCTNDLRSKLSRPKLLRPKLLRPKVLRPGREAHARAGAGRRAIARHIFEPGHVEVFERAGDADPVEDFRRLPPCSLLRGSFLRKSASLLPSAFRMPRSKSSST